ncbi:phage tail protein [Ligilactobacillus sp. WILCCON 0076]|uniref:Phage tail protein n=1 Tax=Ligilactobacillus ubinensis TaxID=2876789 RepID=A0A9X2FKB3_9LACO|nr:phage tail protein [Ligilactobacillus ubinensis]MCP0886925.1 phage tail protein [Ligilactobacillus ubinensis]
MELESLETIFKVDWSNVKEQLQKMQETFQQFGDLTATTAQQSMQKTEQAMDLSEGLRKIQEEIRQVGQTVTESFSKISEGARTGSEKISLNAGKMFSGTKQQVGTDLQAVIAEINAKMQQARAAQAKMNDLIGQKSSLSTAQRNGSEGVKFDSQIATAQAQMTRYQNQAKALAQAMKGEFNAVPESLQRIAKAMDQNEVKIEAYRKDLTRLSAQLKEMQQTPNSMQNDKWANSYAKVERAIIGTREKMNKLISSSDSLNDAYTYVEKRGAALSNVVGTLNTELNQDSTNARRAATYMNEMGSAASRASMNMSKMSGGKFGNFFNKIKSAISSASSSMKTFGKDSESSMNMASRSSKDYSGVINGIRMQLAFLPGQIIVFGLLYNGISQLATGMLSAFKTNTQFSSSLNQIQVNLLTAFYPIYTYVLPAVNALMNALSKATSYIAQFTAALFGMSNSAAKSGASSLYSQIKAMNDTSSSSSSASKAIKEANKQITASNKANKEAVAEANKQITASNKAATKSYEEQKKAAEELSESLQGFDELNVLDSNQSNDLTKPDAQSKETYTPQSLESTDTDSDSDDDGLDFNTPTTQFAGLQDTVNKFKKLLGELFDPMQEAWNSKGKEATEAAKYAWEEVKRALEDVGTSFLHVWDNGTGEKTIELLLQLLADMLNIIGDIGKAFDEAWNHGNAGTKLIQTIFDSLNDVLVLLHDVATSFRQAFNDNNLGEQIISSLIKLATTLFDIIGDIAKAFDQAWQKGDAGTDMFKAILNVANQLLVLLNNIATSFRNAFNDGTGEKIFSNILGIVTDVFDVIGNLASQFDKAWQHGNTGTSIFKTLLGMVNDMLGALKDMADYTVKWSSKLDFSPLLQSLDDLLSAIRPVTKDVFDGIDWAYKNILLPLAKYYISEYLPQWWEDLAAAFKLVGSIINAAKPAFQWIWDSFFEPIAKWTGGVIVAVMKDLASIMSGLADIIDKHKTAFELVAKAIVTMLTVKLVAGGLDKGVGLVGKLADGATILSGNKHLLMDFFGKITGLSDLKSAVTNLKTIKDVTKELVVQNWQNFVADAKNLASITWSSFTKIGTLIIDLSKATWGEFMTYVSGMKKLAQMSWSGLVTAASAIKNWGGWSKAAAVGQAALNVVMDANPFVLLASAIAAIVVALAAWWLSDDKNRKKVAKAWDSFKTSMGQKWDDLKTDAKEKWGKIKEHISDAAEDARKNAKDSWDKLKEKTSTTWDDLKTSTSDKWTTIKENIGSLAGTARDKAGGAWDTIKSHTSDAWSNVSDGTHSTWQSIHDKISNMSDQAKTKALTAWQNLQDNTPGYFRNIKGYASDAWTTITQGAGGLGSNIASGIRSGFQFVQDAMSDLKKYIIDPVKKAVGKIKDGIDWVLSKLGAGSTSWGLFSWASGTANHPGGLAMVNDENSSNYRESYQLPNGKQGIFPDVRNLVLPLPAGTQIKSASETQQSLSQIMPHYATGIGSFDFDFSGLDALANIDWSSIFSGITSTVGDAFDTVLEDVTHPQKLLDYIADKFMSYDWGWTDTQTKLAKGSVGTLENGLTDWASNILEKFGIGTQEGSGAAGWTDAVRKALAKLSLPTTDEYVNAWVKQINTESGGNEKAMGGNDGLSDGNAEGLLQVKPGTFAAYHLSGYNDIWKGWDNMLAGINYAKHRYGSTGMLSVIGHGHGYENGGLVTEENLYPLAEGNKTEMVLPLTNKGRTLQLIKEAMSYIGENFTSGLQMPTTLTADTNLSSLETSVNTNSNTASQIQTTNLEQLGSTIVNGLLQGLQLFTNQSSDNSQTSNITLNLNVDTTKFGQLAIKGINTVNAQNGKNMLNI